MYSQNSLMKFNLWDRGTDGCKMRNASATRLCPSSASWETTPPYLLSSSRPKRRLLRRCRTVCLGETTDFKLIWRVFYIQVEGDDGLWIKVVEKEFQLRETSWRGWFLYSRAVMVACAGNEARCAGADFIRAMVLNIRPFYREVLKFRAFYGASHAFVHIRNSNHLGRRIVGPYILFTDTTKKRVINGMCAPPFIY